MKQLLTKMSNIRKFNSITLVDVALLIKSSIPLSPTILTPTTLTDTKHKNPPPPSTQKIVLILQPVKLIILKIKARTI